MPATHPITSRKPRYAIPYAWVISTLLATAVTAGCRTTTDNQIDILERELRAQEDYIYELEDYILEYSEKLRGMRISGGVVTKSIDSTPEPEIADEPPLDDGPVIADEPEDSGVIPLKPRVSRPIAEEPTAPEDIDIPDLEIGGPTSRNTPQRSNRRATGVTVIPDPTGFAAVPTAEQAEDTLAEQDAAVELVSAEEELETAEPANPTNEIEITQLFGEQPVESLLTVIEQKDAEQAVVEEAGRISLLVLDASGEKPKKLHQWDFTPEESTEAWQATNLGNGLHLALPLDGVELPDGKLELWARFTTADGRKLLTRRRFSPTRLASVDSVPEPSPLPQPALESDELRIASAPEKPAIVEEASKPPRKGSAEVRILTEPIIEKPAPRPASDGWRTSEKQAKPAPVKRAIAAIEAGPKSGGWKQAQTDRRVRTTSAQQTIPTWKVSTQPRKAPEWSPYR